MITCNVTPTTRKYGRTRYTKSLDRTLPPALASPPALSGLAASTCVGPLNPVWIVTTLALGPGVITSSIRNGWSTGITSPVGHPARNNLSASNWARRALQRHNRRTNIPIPTRSLRKRKNPREHPWTSVLETVPTLSPPSARSLKRVASTTWRLVSRPIRTTNTHGGTRVRSNYAQRSQRLNNLTYSYPRVSRKAVGLSLLAGARAKIATRMDATFGGRSRRSRWAASLDRTTTRLPVASTPLDGEFAARSSSTTTESCQRKMEGLARNMS